MLPHIAVLSLAILLATFFWVALKGRSLPVVVALAFFSMIYVGRPLMILAGAETISPRNFFDVPSLVTQSTLVVGLYAISALAGFLMLNRSGRLAASLLPSGATERTWRVMAAAGVVFSAAAVVVGAVLLVQHGNIQNIWQTAKLERGLEATFALRQVAGLGAFFCLCLAANWVCRHSVRRALFWCVPAAVCLAVFSLWGTRLEIIVLVSGFVAAVFLRRDAGLRPATLWKLSSVAIALLTGATALYVYRLYQLSGDWSIALSRDLATTIAVSLHLTRFDSLMLVMQDFAPQGLTRGGQDFLGGLYLAVPRVIWPDKPETLLMGQWFRQTYEPYAVNGWTVGVVGEYLLNFGRLGVVIGGFVFGGLLSVIHHYYHRGGGNQPLPIITGFVLVLIVIPEGSVIQLLPRLILWLVPIWGVQLLARMSFNGRRLV